MKEKIHPRYVEATITCSCGNTWKTHSTKESVHLDICSACHPYFTGEQRIVDTAGRVERFLKRYKISQPS
jgi:large subunit ribosomal protein L31